MIMGEMRNDRKPCRKVGTSEDLRVSSGLEWWRVPASSQQGNKVSGAIKSF
jgi:hypothetical protein